MKALKPSHREKRRYLLLAGKDANKKEIEGAILKFVGILGFAEASPQIVKQAPDKFVISVQRKSLDKIRASFALSGKDIRVLRVSGILNKL